MKAGGDSVARGVGFESLFGGSALLVCPESRGSVGSVSSPSPGQTAAAPCDCPQSRIVVGSVSSPSPGERDSRGPV